MPDKLDGIFVCTIELELNDIQVFDEIRKMENMDLRNVINLPQNVIKLQRSGRYGTQFVPCVPLELVSELREYCACQ